jgi:hypothetical protein
MFRYLLGFVLLLAVMAPSVQRAAGGALAGERVAAAAAGASEAAATANDAVAAANEAASGSVAEVYFWKAKPGKFDEYSRYIREYAKPIDMDAQRHGAFVTVTTYADRRPDAPWTHMRVFILRDSAQQKGLAAALEAAGLRLHPDAAQRARSAAYAQTLRDAAGHESVEIMR